jgi:hypothetical protein
MLKPITAAVTLVALALPANGAVSTAQVTVTDSAYTDVAATATDVSTFIPRDQVIRVIFGGTTPAVGAANFVLLKGPSASGQAVQNWFSIQGLASDSVWIRAESGSVTLTVVKGKVSAGSGP